MTNALHFVEEVLLRPLLAYRFPLSGCPYHRPISIMNHRVERQSLAC